MLKYYTIKDSTLYTLSEQEIIEGQNIPLWIDIINPSKEEEQLIENYLKINIPTRFEMASIELSNRLYKKKENIYATATLTTTDHETQMVTFILMKDKLITVRYDSFSAFDRYVNYSHINLFNTVTPLTILEGLMEAMSGQIADHLEEVGHSINEITHLLFRTKKNKEEEKKKEKLDYKKILRQVGNDGDIISKSHESLISIYRAFNFIIEGRESIKQTEKSHLLMTDLLSLTDHTTFLSNKVNFLLDACLGMIGIDQNTIIKIVSVAALIFFPPTLIASIYGMNFEHMPELKWHLGYPFALICMTLSAILPYAYFKRKGWI